MATHMHASSAVRPKLGRAPSAPPPTLGVAGLTRKHLLLGGGAILAFLLLFSLLISQGSEGAMTARMMAELAPAAGGSASGTDTNTTHGQLVVVSEEAPVALAQGQPLSEADKQRLLAIISAH